MIFQKRAKHSPLRLTALALALACMIFSLTGCMDEPQAPPSEDGAEQSVVLSFFTELQDNEVAPYTLTEKAKTMLAEHGDLFLNNSLDGCEENADHTLEYKALNKNIDNYGDKLLYLEEALVISIEETSLDEETTFTEMLLCDADENYYQVLALCAFDGIYEEDVICFYGLPLGKTGFENVGGGTTLAIVVAAAYAEKLPE